MAKVVLVLGAGGAKGFAHVGALRVLAREGIPIDLIVGASAGVLFGSIYAALGDAERMERFVRRITPGHLLRWYASGLGCEPTSQLGLRLGAVLGDLDFADLKIPLATVSLDLATGEEVVITRGRVAQALRASISPPVNARPVRIGDRFLLDGGVHNTLPVDVAYALGADVVIAVHLGDVFQLPRVLQPYASAFANGLQYAHPPGLLSQVAFTARLLSQGRKARQHKPDVLIRPNMTEISSVSPFQIALSIGRGERAAQAALPRIRQALAKEAAKRPVKGET